MKIEEMKRKYLEPVRISFVLIKERIMLKKYDMPAIHMQESTTLKCINDLIEKISKLEADKLEMAKAIVEDNLYIEDGDTWCNKCGGVNDKFVNSEVIHTSNNCIVDKATKYINK